MRMEDFSFLHILQEGKVFHPHDLFLPEEYEEDQYCLYHEHEDVPENIKCNLCIASVLKTDNKCHGLENEIEHCMFYNNPNSCKTCQYNYKPSDDSQTCVRVKIENCLQVSGNKCVVCADGVMATNGECKKENSCNLENCQVCGMRQNVEYCFVCHSGYATYFESDGQTPHVSCVPEGENTQNCSLLTPGNKDECAVCDVGYYENSTDLCVKSDAYNMDLFGNAKLVVFSLVGLLCML